MALSGRGVNTEGQETLWTNAIIWHQMWAQVTGRRATGTTQQPDGELTSLLSYLPGPRSSGTWPGAPRAEPGRRSQHGPVSVSVCLATSHNISLNM